MRTVRGNFLLMATLGGLCLSVPAKAGPIEDMLPGQWLAVTGSEMRKAVMNPLPTGIYGVEGPEAIIHAWNGGAFDTYRNRLIVWGGGHAAYAGNEIYAFDVNTLTWERVTNPSSLTGWSQGNSTMPDGRPLSVHSYDGLEYIPPPVDRFFAADGSRWVDGFSTGQVWTFDFGAKAWTRKKDLPGGGYYDIVGLSHTSDFDPVTGHVFMYGSYYLVEYNPQNDSWTYRSNQVERPLNMTSAMDTKRRKFLVVGSGSAYVFDLSKSGTANRQSLSSSGGAEIIGCTAPGLAYDPVSDRIVGWCKNSDVYSLNMDTLVWTRHVSTGGTSPGDPHHANYRGTYGRFRYVPSKNVFVVVTHIDKPVYFYKLGSGTGPVSPGKPGTPTVQVK